MDPYRQMWNDLGLNADLHADLLAFEEHSFDSLVRSRPGRPRKMEYFDRAVHESHRGRVREIVEARREGAKMFGTFCIFVPDEIVIAAGGIPIALCGGTSFSLPWAERRFPRDICPLVKSTLGLAFSKTCPYAPLKDLGVGETTCDAKKKTWDILSQKSRFHILELPQKKKERDAGLWREEVRDFRTKVEQLTGNSVTVDSLRNSIRLLNRRRSLLRELNEFRKAPRPPVSGLDALLVMQVALNDDPGRFCGHVEELNAEVGVRAETGVSPFPEKTARVLVAGSPCVMGQWKLHHIIETSGAAVVCDESCTGTRYFARDVREQGQTVEELVDAVAERYFTIDCSCFSPNDERIESVVGLAKEYRVDAVIQNVLQYCHTYHIEAIRIAAALKEAGIPSLTIETDYGVEDEGQLRTRIEALLESAR